LRLLEETLSAEIRVPFLDLAKPLWRVIVLAALPPGGTARPSWSLAVHGRACRVPNFVESLDSLKNSPSHAVSAEGRTVEEMGRGAAPNLVNEDTCPPG
jgi:hypothetical protein